MVAALHLVRQSLSHLNHRGYLYVWANLLWVLLSLPIITAPAAWAGLIYMSRQAHLAPSVTINDFWHGFRENLRRSVVLAFLNIAIVGINLSNLLAYRDQTDTLSLILRGIWLVALATWVLLQFYMWPLLYELQQPSLWGAFRNAAVMIVRNPLYTLSLFAIIWLVSVVSTVLVAMWVLVSASAIAILSTGAVLDRLAAAGLRDQLRPAEIAATNFNVSDVE